MVLSWLEVEQEALKGVVKRAPTRDEIDVPVDEVLIVELYSEIKIHHCFGLSFGTGQRWLLYSEYEPSITDQRRGR